MNLQEFAALKVGDEVENNMLGIRPPGKVTEVTAQGVRVSWGGLATTFLYTVQSTAWMHWSKVEQSTEGEA